MSLSSLLIATLVVAVAAAIATSVASADYVVFPNINAVDGSSLQCIDSQAPFVCLGTAADYASCNKLCQSLNGGTNACDIWAWSPNTHHCWTRTDGKWAPDSSDGYYSGCNNATIKACQVPSPTPVTATLDLSTTLGHMDKMSPAFTFDFWLHNDTRFGQKWNHTGVLELNLNDPGLNYFASEMSPSLLRIGGSPEDSIIYDVFGGCVPGGSGPSANYYCSQVHPYTYGCLTPNRWLDILQFVDRNKLSFTIGLNACHGRKGPDKPMDFSNIDDFLSYTVASGMGDRVSFFEFGNEVSHATNSSNFGVTPSQWVQDVATLAKIIATHYGGSGITPPPIAGPDDFDLLDYKIIADALPKSVRPEAFLAMTYHQYPECTSAAPLRVMEPSCLGELDSVASEMAAIASGKPFLMWAGETADHSGGGVLGLTNTFTSSFYYAWQLGALPAQNISLASRQCFTGGFYELYNTTSGLPNPDFYIAWLTRKLINNVLSSNDVTARAVPITASHNVNETGLRLYAFVNRQKQPVVIAINVNYSVDIPLTVAGLDQSMGAQQVCEYHVQGDPASSTVTINGHSLVTQRGQKLPPASSLAVKSTSTSTTIKAATIAFIVYGCS